MAVSDFNVSITPMEALQALDHGIIDGSITGTRIDCHAVDDGYGHMVIVAVYEKHYYRAGNRLTLTVTISNLRGVTHVHAVGGGGGEGLFRFDWGAGDSFAGSVEKILDSYIIG